MNNGKIDSDTAARRVWLYLRARPGELVSSWELAQETQTVAVSTRVAEVRRELRRLGLPEEIETIQRGHKFFYRLKKIENE